MRVQNSTKMIRTPYGLGNRGGAGRSGTPTRIPRVSSVEQSLANLDEQSDREGIVGSIVSTYNLTSTILGAGILSIAWAMNESGVALGVMLLVLTAILSSLSCNLILSAYLRTGKGSYGDLSHFLFGPGFASLTRWMIILLNVGAASAYILVVKSLLPESLCEIFGHGSFLCGDDESNKNIITGVIVFGIIFPLCTLKDLSSLRHTSMLAFLFAIFLTIAIMVRSVQHESKCDFVYFRTGDFLSLFRGLPVYCFSFVCHLNVLPVYGQLRSRSPQKMRTVFRNAIFFALVLYCTAGVFGYIRFACTGVPDNILQYGYFASGDELIAAARIAEACTCTLALPLIQHPTRIALHTWLFPSPSSEETGDDSDDDSNEGAGQQHQQDSYRQLVDQDEDSETEQHQDNEPNNRITVPSFHHRWRTAIRRLEAFGIIFVAFVMALLIPDVSTIFGLLGSTFCSLVCFILPGTFYLKATDEVFTHFPLNGQYSQREYNDLRRVILQRRLSWLMILFGTIISVLGTIATATK